MHNVPFLPAVLDLAQQSSIQQIIINMLYHANYNDIIIIIILVYSYVHISLPYHITSFILFLSTSIVLILKSIPNNKKLL